VLHVLITTADDKNTALPAHTPLIRAHTVLLTTVFTIPAIKQFSPNRPQRGALCGLSTILYNMSPSESQLGHPHGLGCHLC
jgi:hypothetical protein